MDRQQRVRDGEAEGDGISPTLCRNAVLRATDRPCLRSRSAKAWAASSRDVLYRIGGRSGDADRNFCGAWIPARIVAGPSLLGRLGPDAKPRVLACYMSDLGGEPQPPHVTEPQPVVERNICSPPRDVR